MSTFPCTEHSGICAQIQWIKEKIEEMSATLQKLEQRAEQLKNGLADERYQREVQKLEMSVRDKVLLALLGPMTALAAKAIEIGYQMLSK